MQADETVTLREYSERTVILRDELVRADGVLHASMAALREELLRGLVSARALSDSQREADKTAVGLAHVETLRRLEELNHAHAIAIENWRQSLPREVYEAAVREWQTWRDNVQRQVDQTAGAVSDINRLSSDLKKVEEAVQQALGALTLIRFMGFAGVVALIVTFLRMAKVIP